MAGRSHVCEHIKDIVAAYYTAYPHLRPFAGGVDRAELLQKESASCFAQRKHREERFFATGVNKRRNARQLADLPKRTSNLSRRVDLTERIA
jgi:phage portal protein BeeE